MTKEKLHDILTDIQLAINWAVFDHRLMYCGGFDARYYTPPEEVAKIAAGYIPDYIQGDGIYIFNYEIIKGYTINQLIDLLHHEMTHCYCDVNNIKDTREINGFNYHTKDFKKAIETHGGICEYVNSYMGYCETRLTLEARKKVYKYLNR